MLNIGEGLEFRVLIGERDKGRYDRMLKVAQSYNPVEIEHGLGFWEWKAEPAVAIEYGELDTALNAAQAIREAGEQEAVLLLITCDEDYHSFTYKMLVTAKGFAGAGMTFIRPGLSEDGCGFCEKDARSMLGCFHV